MLFLLRDKRLKFGRNSSNLDFFLYFWLEHGLGFEMINFLLLVFGRALIEENVHWNEDIGEWQLKCVAYTGNNMRRRNDDDVRNADISRDNDIYYVYLHYNDENPVSISYSGGRPRTARRSGTRPKSSRPKSKR